MLTFEKVVPSSQRTTMQRGFKIIEARLERHAVHCPQDAHLGRQLFE